MIDLVVYNKEGQEVEKLKVDESVFGSSVRYPLLKQAIVMHHANRRVGTASTKSRGMVSGSGRKIFKQKGTGFARAGTIRTGKRVGGGVTFAKVSRDFSQRMPKKQRRLAIRSAILAELLSDIVMVVYECVFEKPCTRDFANMLEKLKIKRRCLVTLSDYDDNIYKSARNIPRVSVLPVADLNVADICNKGTMLLTREAFLLLLNKGQSDKN